jgi:phage terminase large subunit-like protein
MSRSGCAGPQHDCAWCDEIAAWRYPQAVDQLCFGSRLWARPRCVITVQAEAIPGPPTAMRWPRPFGERG